MNDASISIHSGAAFGLWCCHLGGILSYFSYIYWLSAVPALGCPASVGRSLMRCFSSAAGGEQAWVFAMSMSCAGVWRWSMLRFGMAAQHCYLVLHWCSAQFSDVNVILVWSLVFSSRAWTTKEVSACFERGGSQSALSLLATFLGFLSPLQHQIPPGGRGSPLHHHLLYFGFFQTG